MLSALRNQGDAAKLLLAAGADPDVPDQQGRTPLMVAAAEGWVSHADMYCCAAVLYIKTAEKGEAPSMPGSQDAHTAGSQPHACA
jgi:hypothetical protein